MSGLVTYGSYQYIDPLVAGEQLPSTNVLFKIDPRYLDGGKTVDGKGPDSSSLIQRIVVNHFDIGPDTAGEKALLFIDGIVIDVNIREPGRSKPGPELPSLNPFIQPCRDKINQLEGSRFLKAGLDKLGLISSNDPLGDSAFHHLQTDNDLKFIGG
ncbi:hypothetical protein ES703_36619 [subsurface metagenome]